MQRPWPFTGGAVLLCSSHLLCEGGFVLHSQNNIQPFRLIAVLRLSRQISMTCACPNRMRGCGEFLLLCCSYRSDEAEPLLAFQDVRQAEERDEPLEHELAGHIRRVVGNRGELLYEKVSHVARCGK
jgi:hypothetical protein